MTATAAIRRAIAARGLTQQDAAALLGISESYLSDVLNKRRGISGFVAVRLEAHFGISAQKLLVDQAIMEWEVAKHAYAKEQP
jgi:plasmid maintenance system antidote protein VapI